MDRPGIFTYYRELGAALAGIRREQSPQESDALAFYEHCRREYRLTLTIVDWMIGTYRVSEIVPITTITGAAALAPLADDPDGLRIVWNDAAKLGNGRTTDSALRAAVAEHQRQQAG